MAKKSILDNFDALDEVEDVVQYYSSSEGLFTISRIRLSDTDKDYIGFCLNKGLEYSGESIAVTNDSDDKKIWGDFFDGIDVVNDLYFNPKLLERHAKNVALFNTNNTKDV